MDDNRFEEEVVDLEEEIETLEDEKFNGMVDEMKQAFIDVKNNINNMVADLKTKLTSVDLSKEKMQSYLDEFTKAVNDTVEKAGVKYNEFKNSPKAVETWNKAKEAVSKASESVKKAASDVYDKAMDNEGVKNTTDKVSETVKNATDKFAEKYHDFTHDPKVRETVVGATNVVKDVFNSAVDVVKSALKTEEENTEEGQKEE